MEHWPERCHACAHAFAEQELVDAVEPWRHQVAELPAIAVCVSEHRLHGLCCPECATATRAELPRQLPRSAFGPRLQAAVVTLAVITCRPQKRSLFAYLSDVLTASIRGDPIPTPA